MGVFGGAAAALLLIAPATNALAQPAPKTLATTVPAPIKHSATTATAAAKTKKPAATKIATKKSETVKRLATTKLKSPAGKFAAISNKPASAKKITVATKESSAPTKLAAVTPKPMLASYTVTTTRGNVTYTTTHIVPPAPASVDPPVPVTAQSGSLTPPMPVSTAPSTATTTAAAMPASLTQPMPTSSPPTTTTQVAALPVSLTQPVETAPPLEKAVAVIPEKPTETAPEKPVALPAKTDEGPSFVSNFLKAAFRIAKSDGKTSLQRRAELADLFASKMDLKFIAGYTTADELTGASTDIQQRFRAILASYLVETYYPRLELASDPSVAVDISPAERLPDNSLVVWSTFTKQGWGSQSVKWRLMAEDGGFKIIDMFSAGASLVQMERDTFHSVMRNGGLNELMAQLDARTKQLAAAATE